MVRKLRNVIQAEWYKAKNKEEVNNTSDDIERARDAAYRLYDSFEKEAQQEATYDGLVFIIFNLQKYFTMTLVVSWHSKQWSIC